MPDPEEQKPRLHPRLIDNIVGRAIDGAIKTYDDAVEEGKTPAEASIVARKVYVDVLKPWGI